MLINNYLSKLDIKKIKFLDKGIINFMNTNIYENNNGFNNQLFYYLSFIGYLGMNFLVGFPIASVFFINCFIIFHNKKDFKIKDLINYSSSLYLEQGFEIENNFLLNCNDFENLFNVFFMI